MIGERRGARYIVPLLICGLRRTWRWRNLLVGGVFYECIEKAGRMAGMWEEIMNTILVKAKKIIGKAALATVALGGFLGFFGAGTASAHPRFYVYGGYGRPYPVYAGPRYYYQPAPIYVGPVYGPYRYYRPHRYHRVYRFWDERDHCWRYR